MDVNLDPGIIGIIRARKLDRRRTGTPPAAARDGDLVATDIELGAARLARRVQGQRLGAQQVVARGDVGGDLDVHLAAAGAEVARAPVVVVADAATGLFGPRVGEDLEPACGAVGRARVGDFGQVDLHGAIVGAADGFVVAFAVAGLLRWCVN